MREKAWRDEMDRIDGAIAKSNKEHVKNMYADGLAPEQIARYLRIEVSTVKEIPNLQ